MHFKRWPDIKPKKYRFDILLIDCFRWGNLEIANNLLANIKSVSKCKTTANKLQPMQFSSQLDALFWGPPTSVVLRNYSTPEFRNSGCQMVIPYRGFYYRNFGKILRSKSAVNKINVPVDCTCTLLQICCKLCTCKTRSDILENCTPMKFLDH